MESVESVDAQFVNHQAMGTYLWISSTWWYHQRYFKSSKNALNLAFFEGVAGVLERRRFLWIE